MPRGRPPKPIELHRRHGTYRPDRHGLKLLAPVTPPVPVLDPLLRLAYGEGGNDFLCPDCDARLTIELWPNRTWTHVHDDDSECPGAG